MRQPSNAAVPRRLAVVAIVIGLGLLATSEAAWAGTKALVNKVVITPDGALMRVALPLLAIEAIGATLVEDYDEMAVVDLGPATADALAKATGLGVSPLPDHDKVLLRNYTFDSQGWLPTGLEARTYPDNAPDLCLVVLRSIPKAEWVARLQTVGQVVTYIPSNAYLVYTSWASIQAARSRAPEIINMLPFVPEFKILDSERLYGTEGSARALVQVLKGPTAQPVVDLIKAYALPGTFGSFDLGTTTAVMGELPNDVVQGLALHPEVLLIEPAPQLEVSGEREALIVAGQLVSAQEGGRTVYKPNSAADYYSWLSQNGLANASDIYLGFVDTGLDLGSTSNVHKDFKDSGGNSRVAYQGNPAGAPDPSDCTGHGTLVAAMMAGSGGASSYNTDFSESATLSSPCAGCTGSCPTPTNCASGLFWAGAGVAPAARIASSKIYDESGTDWPSVPNRVANGLANLAGLGAWVTNLSSNDIYTGYTSFSQLLDQRVRDATGIGLQLPMTIVVSAGNNGGNVLAPATAKDVIAVGASEGYNPFLDQSTCFFMDPTNPPTPDLADDAYDVATFSCSGTPASDGRTKPDLVAPGSRVMGALTRKVSSNCWGFMDCGRNPAGTLPGMGGSDPITWSWGTSFAAPQVTGAAGLVSKWYKATHSGVLPSPAMVKAMLINAALDIQGGLRFTTTVDHIPSNYQGWGKVDLARAFPASNDYFNLDQSYPFTVSGGSPWSRVFTVNNPAQLIRVTLVWTDAPADPNSSHPLLNDLDLRVYQIDGLSNCWVAPGNTSILESYGTSGFWRCDSNYSLDTLNNVEQVIFLPTLNPYGFTVTVTPRSLTAKAVPGGSGTVNQDFALFVENAR